MLNFGNQKTYTIDIKCIYFFENKVRTFKHFRQINEKNVTEHAEIYLIHKYPDDPSAVHTKL